LVRPRRPCVPGDEMSDKVYEVPAEWTKRAFVKDAEYKTMYSARSPIPTAFGRTGQAHPLDEAVHQGQEHVLRPPNVSIKWFEDGATNAAYNCIDRHLAKRGDQTAIIWEGDDPKDSKKITYQELHAEVCRFANVLRNRNVKKATASPSTCR